MSKRNDDIKAEIMAEVVEKLLTVEERWVTGKDLTQQFACFTTSWLKEYGRFLPRMAVTVKTAEKTTTTHFVYPVHRINKMLQDGELSYIQAIGA